MNMEISVDSLRLSGAGIVADLVEVSQVQEGGRGREVIEECA